MVSPDLAVEVRGLTYRYAAGLGPSLDDLTLAVPRGDIFAILGPNGAGKTTLFRILSTYFPAPPGMVSVLGADPAADPARVRRRIGVVFQNPSLDKRLTVEENLRHQGRLYGLSGSELSARVAAALERAGLAARSGELVLTLSGGLQRRVELAKGLLHGPELLILDEPSTGLDPGARKDLWQQLKELQARDQTTILVTTHWMEEAERCDRLAILSEGRLVALGTPAELRSAIGGDVISLESEEPEALAAGIRERLGLEAAVVDGTVRLEAPDGHRLIPRLAEAFSGRVRSITLGRPTLEDVFIHRTGHKFWRASAP